MVDLNVRTSELFRNAYGQGEVLGIRRMFKILLLRAGEEAGSDALAALAAASDATIFEMVESMETSPEFDIQAALSQKKSGTL
jgi:hypothetical protein